MGDSACSLASPRSREVGRRASSTCPVTSGPLPSQPSHCAAVSYLRPVASILHDGTRWRRHADAHVSRTVVGVRTGSAKKDGGSRRWPGVSGTGNSEGDGCDGPRRNRCAPGEARAVGRDLVSLCRLSPGLPSRLKHSQIGRSAQGHGLLDRRLEGRIGLQRGGEGKVGRSRSNRSGSPPRCERGRSRLGPEGRVGRPSRFLTRGRLRGRPPSQSQPTSVDSPPPRPGRPVVLRTSASVREASKGCRRRVPIPSDARPSLSEDGTERPAGHGDRTALGRTSGRALFRRVGHEDRVRVVSANQVGRPAPECEGSCSRGCAAAPYRAGSQARSEAQKRRVLAVHLLVPADVSSDVLRRRSILS